MNLAQSNPSYKEFGDEEVKGIVVRGYSVMGALNGLNYSSAQVEAREALIPDSRMADYSVRIELSTGGDYPQTSIASINYRDVDDVLAMLDKLSSTNITTDRFQFSEVQYEIDGFSVIVFNNDRGSLMVALTHAGVTVHLNSVSKIAELRKLIASAKDCLSQRKIG